MPFNSAIAAGADMIVAAHIACPQITGDGTPSSLSSVMITDVLRGELGFDGIIITEAMNAEAITSHYTSADAALAAVNAGVDMILMPQSFQEAYQALVDAVNNGEISRERIDDSVRRILQVKLTI